MMQVIWEKGTSIETIPHQICPGARMWYIFLIDNWCGGWGWGAAHHERCHPWWSWKQAKKHHSSFRDGLSNNSWLLVPALLRVPPSLPSVADCAVEMKTEINLRLYPHADFGLWCFIAAKEMSNYAKTLNFPAQGFRASKKDQVLVYTSRNAPTPSTIKSWRNNPSRKQITVRVRHKCLRPFPSIPSKTHWKYYNAYTHTI